MEKLARLEGLVNSKSLVRVLVGPYWVGVKEGSFKFLDVNGEIWCRWEEPVGSGQSHRFSCPFRSIAAFQS
jgi:hypothetical protein